MPGRETLPCLALPQSERVSLHWLLRWPMPSLPGLALGIHAGTAGARLKRVERTPQAYRYAITPTISADTARPLSSPQKPAAR